MKRVWLRIILGIVTLFLVFNIFWFFKAYRKYDSFTEGFEEFRRGISYIYVEESNTFIYNVRYPAYLSFTGNVAVGTTDGEYGLIIWPSVFGETTFGVQVPSSDSGFIYSIMLDEYGETTDQEVQHIVEENREMIDILFQRARERWPGL